MAQSRLEKIGTIFSRVTGLLKSGAMKLEDKPLWYDVYAAFPPKLEPKFDRPAPNIKLRQIFYEEDVARAYFHKMTKSPETINLMDIKTNSQSQCQQYVEIYNLLKSQGALDDKKIKEVAYDMLKDKLETGEDQKNAISENIQVLTVNNEISKVNLNDLFKE